MGSSAAAGPVGRARAPGPAAAGLNRACCGLARGASLRVGCGGASELGSGSLGCGNSGWPGRRGPKVTQGNPGAGLAQHWLPAAALGGGRRGPRGAAGRGTGGRHEMKGGEGRGGQGSGCHAATWPGNLSGTQAHRGAPRRATWGISAAPASAKGAEIYRRAGLPGFRAAEAQRAEGRRRPAHVGAWPAVTPGRRIKVNLSPREFLHRPCNPSFLLITF